MNKIKMILLLLSMFSFSKDVIKIFDKNKEKISYVYELKNKRGVDLKKSLEIYDNVKFQSFENKIIMYGSKENIENIKDMLDKLDTLKKQVLIKVSLLDVTKNLIDRLGIKFIKKENESLIRYIQEDRDRSLEKYKKSGDIKLKLMPSVIILNGEVASLNISKLKLDLKPIIHDRYIELHVEIEFISYDNKKEYIKTTINVKDNKPIYISQNKIFENRSFSYQSKSKILRDLYIQIEAMIYDK